MAGEEGVDGALVYVEGSIRSAAAWQGHSLAYTHLDILSAASVRARSNLATVCTVACTLLPCCRLRSWAARTSCRSCSWSRGVEHITQPHLIVDDRQIGIEDGTQRKAQGTSVPYRTHSA